MSNEGFNPEDIEDTLSRFGRGHKKSARPATAGIPSFVPREPAIQNNVNTPRNEVVWAAAADHAEQQQAQELPPLVLALVRLISTSFWRGNRRNIR